MFSAVKTYAILQNRQIGCVYKTKTKHASKDEIELAVLKSFQEVLVHLLAVLLVDGFSFVHTVIYDAHKQAHNNEKEIKILSLSSNRKQLRYGDRSNIFGRFPNDMAKTMLGMAW